MPSNHYDFCPFFFFFPLRERDADKDGKANFDEFSHGVFDLVINHDEEGQNSFHPSDYSMDAETPAKRMFSQLDKDGDRCLYQHLLFGIMFEMETCSSGWLNTFPAVLINRLLSDEELLPIIGKLHPSERYYAKQQADYIISQVFYTPDN